MKSLFAWPFHVNSTHTRAYEAVDELFFFFFNKDQAALVAAPNPQTEPPALWRVLLGRSSIRQTGTQLHSVMFSHGRHLSCGSSLFRFQVFFFLIKWWCIKKGFEYKISNLKLFVSISFKVRNTQCHGKRWGLAKITWNYFHSSENKHFGLKNGNHHISSCLFLKTIHTDCKIRWLPFNPRPCEPFIIAVQDINLILECVLTMVQ